MNIKLYPHQQEAVEKLRSGSILCGGVGSGKSITAIYYFFKKICDDMKNPMDLYIITTARKRDTLEWDKECARFSISKNQEDSIGNIKLIIDSWNNIKKYEKVSESFFIFDEQRVVGSGSWVKSFLKITKNNMWILLSATPGDTWSDYIPVFIANGFYKNRTDFSRQHIVYDRYSRYPKIDNYIECGKLTSYLRSILVMMDYNRTRNIHKEDIICSYDKDKYKYVIKNRVDPFKNEEPIDDASNLCYILRRIVNEDKSRLEAVRDLVLRNEKIIIFYNYDYELELLKKFFLDFMDIIFNDFSYSEWNGHKHQEIPKTNKWVYLVQYSAGSEGWNCTETNVIIFFSQNYSYRSMVQAAGRIDRINSPFEDLYYYRLRSSSPIDVAINRALINKKSFNEKNFVRNTYGIME